MNRINNTLYELLDQYTGELVTYNKVTTLPSGNTIVDADCDGIIYKKLGTEYFRRNYTGYISPNWFGAKGDGINDDTVYIQKAINYISLTGGTVSLPNTYKVTTLNLKKGVNLTGGGTLLGTTGNSILRLSGSVTGEYWDFDISRLSFKYDTFTPGEYLTTNNAIEVLNVSRGNISRCYFEKVNAPLYVVPTGKFQQTSRITLDNCRAQYINYGYKVEETPDTVNGVAVTSKRAVGDMTISNYVIQWAFYDHVFAFGADGLKIDNVYTFSSPTDESNKSTKRCNINIHRSTRLIFNNLHLFEAGEDGIRLTDCNHVQGNAIRIDWCGQRLASSGIHIKNITTIPDIERNITFTNVQIDTPTLHGIYIEGPFPSKSYTFRDITVHKLGRDDRYYGASGSYSNPVLSTYPHNTIYADQTTSGVYYDGNYDSEWITRNAKLLGSGSIATDFNTRRGTSKQILSPESVIDTNLDVYSANIVENLLPSSNALSTNSRFTLTSVSASVVSATASPFGTGDIYRIYEYNTVNTQRSISTATVINKPTVADLPYTFSFYVKPDEIQFICVYVTNNGFSSGIKIDYDVLNGQTGAIDNPGTGYKLLRSNIKRANNGFFRIEVSFISPAAHTTVKGAIYLKDAIQNPGNQSYTSLTGTAGIYLSDFQLSQTSVAIPYIQTIGGNAIPQTKISPFKSPIIVQTANYTMTNADRTISMDATSGNLTVTLLAALSCYINNTGQKITIKKVDASANTITIDASGSETIDGSLTKVLTLQYDAITIQSDGTGWVVLNKYTA